MAQTPGLEETVRRYSGTLYGGDVAPSQLVITPVAKGTREIFRVRASTPGLPVLIAKARSHRTHEEGESIAAQTAHEFAVHSAVWTSMRAAGVAEHRVPKPLLAIPEQGLLIMEEAEGEPIARALWRDTFALRNPVATENRIRRCGEWLCTFTCRAPSVVMPQASPRAASILAEGRVRHHVYSLIGLSGRHLVDTMLAQVRRRLGAYRVESDLMRRIQEAFEEKFRDFGGRLDPQGNVHGKFSIADVLAGADVTYAIDLEQAGRGSLYLDPAYFLFQSGMATRWRPFNGRQTSSALRRAFMAGRSPGKELDEGLLDAFVAYYLVNSFRPGDGLAGLTARAYARRWIVDWLDRA